MFYSLKNILDQMRMRIVLLSPTIDVLLQFGEEPFFFETK